MGPSGGCDFHSQNRRNRLEELEVHTCCKDNWVIIMIINLTSSTATTRIIGMRCADFGEGTCITRSLICCIATLSSGVIKGYVLYIAIYLHSAGNGPVFDSLPPRWDTEPYCISSCSSDFPPNAGLWLVDRFPDIFSKTISPINFILGIHDLRGGVQNHVAYRCAPAISHWMLASDWSMGFWTFSPKQLAQSTSYLVYMTSYVGYILRLHIVTLQRFSAECCPLIGRLG